MTVGPVRAHVPVVNRVTGVTPMRIELSGSSAARDGRMRAYAEYRVFSQLAAFAGQVTMVQVVVSRSTDDRLTSCVMSVELKHGGRIQSRSRSRQPARAIDSAAKKLAEATGRRIRGGGDPSDGEGTEP